MRHTGQYVNTWSQAGAAVLEDCGTLVWDAVIVQVDSTVEGKPLRTLYSPAPLLA
jgi:hypothetical protein